jgi:hypothetical protein
VPGSSQLGSELLMDLNGVGCLNRRAAVISAIKALRHVGTAIS